jgi:hypothetical protein
LRFPQDPHHLFLAESALFHFVLPLLSGQNYIFKTSLRLGSGHLSVSWLLVFAMLL